MRYKKKRNIFDMHIEPLKIPRYRINPELLRIIVERKKLILKKEIIRKKKQRFL